MGNSGLERVIAAMDGAEVSYEIVRHPAPTRSVSEKRAVYESNPEMYARFGPITIVQGSLLSYTEVRGNKALERVFAYFHDGEERIMFNELARMLHLNARTDLVFYKGKLRAFVKAQNGAISPLTVICENLYDVVFDGTLVRQSIADHSQAYDMALSGDTSMIASVFQVYLAMSREPLVSRKLKVLG